MVAHEKSGNGLMQFTFVNLLNTSFIIHNIYQFKANDGSKFAIASIGHVVYFVDQQYVLFLKSSYVSYPVTLLLYPTGP